VFHFVDEASQFKGPLGTPTEGYTVVIVGSIDSARLAGVVNSYLASSYNPDDPGGGAYAHEIDIKIVLETTPDFLTHTPELDTASNALNVNMNLAPGGDEVAVWGVSFDPTPASGSRTSETFVNDVFAPLGTKLNHTQKPRVGANDYWQLGSAPQFNELGWVGKMGCVFFFNQPFHVATPGFSEVQNRQRLQDLIDALKELYGIA
jgi:hypothetical protein